MQVIHAQVCNCGITAKLQDYKYSCVHPIFSSKLSLASSFLTIQTYKCHLKLLTCTSSNPISTTTTTQTLPRQLVQPYLPLGIMQFNALFVLATTAAMTGLGLAQENATCTYTTGSYFPICWVEDSSTGSLICSGNLGSVGDQGICDRNPLAPKTQILDEESLRRNRDACVGLSRGDACTQTALCCLNSS